MLREEIDELKKVNILAEILLEKKSLEKEDESLNKFNYFTILCSVFVCCMCLFMLYVSYQNIDDTLGKWDINLEFQDLYNYIIKNDKSAILQNVNAATTNIIDGIKESMQKTLDNRNSNTEFSLKKMISAIPRYLTSQTIFGTALSDSKNLLKEQQIALQRAIEDTTRNAQLDIENIQVNLNVMYYTFITFMATTVNLLRIKIKMRKLYGKIKSSKRRSLSHKIKVLNSNSNSN